MPTWIRDRDALGEAAFDAARAEGRAHSSERALEYALEQPATRDDAVAPPAPPRLTRRELEVLRLAVARAAGSTCSHPAPPVWLENPPGPFGPSLLVPGTWPGQGKPSPPAPA
jgi:hypothetical protein